MTERNVEAMRRAERTLAALEEDDAPAELTERYDSTLGANSKFRSVASFSDFENLEERTGIEQITFTKDDDVKPHELLDYTRTRPEFKGVCTFEWYEEIAGSEHLPRTAQTQHFKVEVAHETTSYQVLSQFMNPDSSRYAQRFALRHAIDLIVGEDMFVTLPTKSPSGELKRKHEKVGNRVCKTFEGVTVRSHTIELFEPKNNI